MKQTERTTLHPAWSIAAPFVVLVVGFIFLVLSIAYPNWIGWTLLGILALAIGGFIALFIFVVIASLVGKASAELVVWVARLKGVQEPRWTYKFAHFSYIRVDQVFSLNWWLDK